MSKASELARPVSEQMSRAREQSVMAKEEAAALRLDIERCEAKLEAISMDHTRLAELRYVGACAASLQRVEAIRYTHM